MKNWFWKLANHFSYNPRVRVMKKFSKLNLIFCCTPDLRKIFSRAGKLEDTVNLTFVCWCLKASAKALCSLGKIFFLENMFLKYLSLLLVLADFGRDSHMENVTLFVDNLAWASGEWWLQSESSVVSELNIYL